MCCGVAPTSLSTPSECPVGRLSCFSLWSAACLTCTRAKAVPRCNGCRVVPNPLVLCQACNTAHTVLFLPLMRSRASAGICVKNNTCLCDSVPIPFLDPYLKPGWSAGTGLYAVCLANCTPVASVTPFVHPDWPGARLPLVALVTEIARPCSGMAVHDASQLRCRLSFLPDTQACWLSGRLSWAPRPASLTP